MALANFLGKSALSASQILKDFDYEVFQEILLSHNIRICFDKKTAASAEGFAAVDLLVRLCARLYPNLHLQCTDGHSNELLQFNELACAINAEIDMTPREPTIAIIVGDNVIRFHCQHLYIGSDQWLAKFSITTPQICGHSGNRLGAGAAACFAAANLFRFVFNKQLADGALDAEFVYSVFNGKIDSDAQQGPAISTVHLEDTVLVGLGAIGNGAGWALKDVALEGHLQMVDGERIDSGNLQRYVLTTQDDLNKPKSLVLSSFLSHPAIIPIPYHFDMYVAARGDWDIYRVAVCVDSAEDRRIVQGSLPKRLINAWTQQEQCGLSRHHNFLNDPCLVCLYMPAPEEKSESVKIAESLGIKDPLQVMMVRQYMADQKLVDEPMIQVIAAANEIDAAQLRGYAGKSLRNFYSEVICGGVMIQLTGGAQQKAAEVPAAFESAMAGIMLAAELIIDGGNLRVEKGATIQKLNLIRPITKYTSESKEKGCAPDCICQDPAYQQAYASKWKLAKSGKRVPDPAPPSNLPAGEGHTVVSDFSLKLS